MRRSFIWGWRGNRLPALAGTVGTEQPIVWQPPPVPWQTCRAYVAICKFEFYGEYPARVPAGADGHAEQRRQRIDARIRKPASNPKRRAVRPFYGAGRRRHGRRSPELPRSVCRELRSQQQLAVGSFRSEDTKLK